MKKMSIGLFACLQFVVVGAQAKTPQEPAGHLKADLAKWAKVVKEAGITPE